MNRQPVQGVPHLSPDEFFSEQVTNKPHGNYRKNNLSQHHLNVLIKCNSVIKRMPTDNDKHNALFSSDN